MLLHNNSVLFCRLLFGTCDHIRGMWISNSYVYAVSFLDCRQEQETLKKWAAAKGPEALPDRHKAKNVRNLGGLAAFDEA